MRRRIDVWIAMLLSMGGCWPLVRKPAHVCKQTVRVIFTGELRGELEPCGCSQGMVGGLARRDTAVRRLLAEQPNAILLDTGDLTVGIGRQVELKAETALLAMQELGYTAMSVGEGDLEMGLDSLRSVMEVAEIPVVCANLLRGGKPVFPAYMVKEIKPPHGAPMRVAIVGVLSPDFEKGLQRIDDKFQVLPPARALVPLVNKLEDKAQLLILLAHMNAGEADYVAAMFPEFALVVCGHGETDPLVRPQRTQGGWLCTTGAKGDYVSYVDVSVCGRRVELVKHEVLCMGPDVPSAKATVALIDDYLNSVAEEKLIERALSNDLPPGGTPYVGTAKCKRCHIYSFVVWRKSAHAHALETLERGGRGHNLDPECVRCHVVGFPYKSGFRSRSQTPGMAHVGCESCHGPGKNHIDDTKKPYGKTGEARCRQCHTPERSTGFDYAKYFPKIQHAKRKTAHGVAVPRGAGSRY